MSPKKARSNKKSRRAGPSLSETRAAQRVRKQAQATAQTRKMSDWPLHAVYTNRAWQESLRPTVLIVRERPGSSKFAAAIFQIDLGALGVVGCEGLRDLSRKDLDATVRRISDAIKISPALGASIIESAHQYALELGLEQPDHFQVMRDFYRDVDPTTCDTPVECGREGRPLLVGSYAELSTVVEHLTQRLGPKGFICAMHP